MFDKITDKNISPIELSEEEYKAKLNILLGKYDGVEPTTENATGIVNDCMITLGGSMPISREDLGGRDLWFYRIRLRKTFQNEEDFFNPSQHLNPSAEYCKTHGRCHVKGHPVFYGSSSVQCAVKEMDTPAETDYILSIWKLPAQQKVKTAVFLMGDDLKNEELKNFRQEIFDFDARTFDVNDEHEKLAMENHSTIWSNLFTANDKHTLSASVAHQILYLQTNDNHAIIQYPSVRTKKDVNYAIHPELAHKMVLHRLVDIHIDPTTKRDVWRGVCDSNTLRKWRSVEKTDYPNYDPSMSDIFS